MKFKDKLEEETGIHSRIRPTITSLLVSTDLDAVFTDYIYF